MATRTRSASQVRYSLSQLLSERFMKRLHKSLKQYGPPPVEILATEIVQTSDPLPTNPRMIAAKHSEIRDLIRRRTFIVIWKQKASEGATVLPLDFTR